MLVRTECRPQQRLCCVTQSAIWVDSSITRTCGRITSSDRRNKPWYDRHGEAAVKSGRRTGLCNRSRQQQRDRDGDHRDEGQRLDPRHAPHRTSPLCTGWYCTLDRNAKLQIYPKGAVARSPRRVSPSTVPWRPIAKGPPSFDDPRQPSRTSRHHRDTVRASTRRCPLLRQKQTCAGNPGISPFDPKRTCRQRLAIWPNSDRMLQWQRESSCPRLRVWGD
jgi:hypothetical protein